MRSIIPRHVVTSSGQTFGKVRSERYQQRLTQLADQRRRLQAMRNVAPEDFSSGIDQKSQLVTNQIDATTARIKQEEPHE